MFNLFKPFLAKIVQRNVVPCKVASRMQLGSLFNFVETEPVY